MAWGCLTYGLWFLFTGERGAATAVWGAGATACAALAAALVVGRRPLRGGRARWTATAPSIAWQALVDFLIVTAVLVRSIRRGDRGPVGHLVRRPSAALGDGAAMWRAWLATAATYSPNAYVLDIDRDTGQALLHGLRPRPS